MADITDPEAVKFSNEKIRTLADKLAQTFYQLTRLRDEWVANGLGAKFPNDTSPVIDGSATDGRHPITGADVNAIASRATEFLTDYEASANAKLNTVLKVAVNPNR